MPKRLVFAMALIALASGPAVTLGQPSAPVTSHGYALPTDRSPAADALPRADPPTQAGWNRDLDLPRVEDYQQEVLRYVRTGLAPALVVQFAVVAPGGAVQVMVEKSNEREHTRIATRAFGQVPWSEFLRLRAAALGPMSAPPPEPAPAASGEISVEAVDQVCLLEYSGLGLTVRRRLDCGDVGPLQDARQALLDAAERTVGAARSPLAP
jgi:hypothetical protein